MKKIISAVAALGLVAGLATTASALDLSVSGSYQLIGAVQNNALGAGNGVALAGAVDNGSDAFYFHSFVMDPTLKVNDNITMKSNIRLADRNVWGLDDTNNAPTSVSTTGSDSGRQIDVRQIYMEYMSPVGKFRVGRVPTSAWGGKFIDSASEGNRIMWWPSFVGDPFSLLLFTQKIAEADAGAAASSNGDTDGYYIGFGHKAEMGSTDVALFHTRANNNALLSNEGVVVNNLWYYGKYKISNISIDAELSYSIGDSGVFVGATQSDRDALAAELDVTGTFGALSVGALYFYVSGDDATTADVESFGTTGNDFNPYLILTGDWTGILNTDKGNFSNNNTDPNAVFGLVAAGAHSLGLHASYQVSPQLSLSGAIGSAWADETAAGQDDSYGMEYDLNAAYKLLDNLTYSAHFGYLDTGDFFKVGVAATPLNSITFMAHAITMTF